MPPNIIKGSLFNTAIPFYGMTIYPFCQEKRQKFLKSCAYTYAGRKNGKRHGFFTLFNRLMRLPTDHMQERYAYTENGPEGGARKHVGQKVITA